MQKRLSWVAAILLAVVASTFTALSPTNSPQTNAPAATHALAWQDLPPAALQVGRRIGQGGPFAYDKDGSVFGNRERLLPPQKRGYYREYTVPTPGLDHRGARRIVCGGLQARAPEQCFYTDDHYDSFRSIAGALPQ